jgi:hypothetical protein
MLNHLTTTNYADGNVLKLWRHASRTEKIVLERYWRVEEHLARLIEDMKARGMPNLFAPEIAACMDELHMLPSSVVVEGVDFHLGRGEDKVAIELMP